MRHLRRAVFQPIPHRAPSTLRDMNIEAKLHNLESPQLFPSLVVRPASLRVSRTTAEMPSCPRPSATVVHLAAHLQNYRHHWEQTVPFLPRPVVPTAHALATLQPSLELASIRQALSLPAQFAFHLHDSSSPALPLPL